MNNVQALNMSFAEPTKNIFTTPTQEKPKYSQNKLLAKNKIIDMT